MTWRPKFAVRLSYYDRFRLRSDAFAALFLALQIFPLAIAIAVATGVPPIYGVLCAAIAGLLASVFGDSKVRVTAPNAVFVAVASSIVAREGILALSLSTLSAGVLLVFFGSIGLGAGIRMLPLRLMKVPSIEAVALGRNVHFDDRRRPTDSHCRWYALIGMLLYIRKKPSILTKSAPGTSNNP